MPPRLPPPQVKHVAADRKDYPGLKEKLSAHKFDVVYDMNAREAEEVEGVLAACPGIKQYIFCSSAGVYLKSDQMPHLEQDATDPKSRHKGKLDSEAVLAKSGVAWTSVRPVYIYGPLNYNPVEEYFFHRIAAGRPICIPASGMQITQLGHVADLSDAFSKARPHHPRPGCPSLTLTAIRLARPLTLTAIRLSRPLILTAIRLARPLCCSA